MSKSTPEDIAIVFRGLPRRIADARGGAPDAAVQPELERLEALVQQAGAALHCTPDIAAIAHALDDTPADEWSDATLDTMRDIALQIGAEVRSLAAIGERFTTDDD